MSVPVRFAIIGVVLFGALFYLWPTWRYSQINAEREALLADTTQAGRDKLAAWDSLHYEDWLDYRERRLKLGLDLRGGVYFTMEVDIPALLEENVEQGLADDTFAEVMAAVREEARTSDDPVLDIFEEKFNEIAVPKGKSLIDYYAVSDGSGEDTDEAILRKLGADIDDAVARALEVIRQRVDKSGLTEPSIQQQGSRRIIVELPDEKDPSRVRELLSRTARMEFKLVRNDAQLVSVFKQIDQLLSGEAPTPGTDAVDTNKVATTTNDTTTGDTANDSTGPVATTTDSNTTPTNDSNGVADGKKPDSTKPDTGNDPYKGLTDQQKVEKYRRLHPFTSNFATYYQQAYKGESQPADGIYEQPSPIEGEYTFILPKENIEKIRKILARPDVRSLLPQDRQIAFSAYPRDPSTEDSPYEMFGLKADAEMTGEDVVDASGVPDALEGIPVVNMSMNLHGAELWSEVTGNNIHKRVAVVLDSSVYSAPWIEGKIPGGQTRITGSNDLSEAELLATILKSGALKAPIHIIEERIVGPSLGADQIEQGINAVLFAALLVILFMAVYYGVGGIVADVAVALNVFFTLAFLAAMPGTLTLPGIGALVLTIGMAVDANILIYERIREELALGKSLKNAVQLGYEKAFSAIIDSNITTFLTGLILYAFGSGPIQGFATMLMLGIVATLFTAIFVTRAVFMLMLNNGAQNINFGQAKTRSV